MGTGIRNLSPTPRLKFQTSDIFKNDAEEHYNPRFRGRTSRSGGYGGLAKMFVGERQKGQPVLFGHPVIAGPNEVA